MEVRMSGEVGELRVCYQRAAQLGRWQMLPASGRGRYSITADLVSTNAYWMTQHPLDIALVLGGTEWLWRDVAVTQDGRQVRVEVSEPPIVSPVA